MTASKRTNDAPADVSLVVLAKAPELGRVKSRLAASIGAEAALLVYRQLLAITAKVVDAWPGPVMLATTGDVARFEGGPLARCARMPQPAGDLGPRIAAALRSGLRCAGATIVIGTDCPGLGIAPLRIVAMALARAPVSFGPATDGGFWAIATSTANTADVLEHAKVAWSSASTLAEVREHLAQAGLRSGLGPELGDCDDLTDLREAIAAGLLPPLTRQP